MSGFKPQSLQTSTTPSLSWQRGLTSNPSTALLGPLSVPHLLTNTPSGDSPKFNPYRTALKTPTPTPDNPDAELKPNMAVRCCKAILRKDFKKDPQINMIFEEICSEFYLLAVTEHIFIGSGDYKKKISQLVHHAFQQLNCKPFEISNKCFLSLCLHDLISWANCESGVSRVWSMKSAIHTVTANLLEISKGLQFNCWNAWCTSCEIFFL